VFPTEKLFLILEEERLSLRADFWHLMAHFFSLAKENKYCFFALVT
jgi:hypothetical protein